MIWNSITRLPPRLQHRQPHSGKILSDGVDANALHKPKRFFGAAHPTSGWFPDHHGHSLIGHRQPWTRVIFERF